MPRFHPLEVTDIRRETRDAVVLTLRPRAEDAAALSQAWRLAGAKDWAGADAAARASGLSWAARAATIASASSPR